MTLHSSFLVKWYASAKWVLERVVGPGGLAPP
jgi:hypothetical protein